MIAIVTRSRRDRRKEIKIALLLGNGIDSVRILARNNPDFCSVFSPFVEQADKQRHCKPACQEASLKQPSSPSRIF